MRSMTVFNYLLEATLFGSVLILLMVAVRSLLRDRLGSRVIYGGWLMVAARLLLPLSLPNPVMDEFRPGLSVDVAARPVADQVRQRVIDLGRSVVSLLDSREDSLLYSFVVRTSDGKTGRWLLIMWLAVALVVACWLWWRMSRFADGVRRSRVRSLEGDERDMFISLCKRYRIKPLPVYYADRLAAGCVVGVWKPFIALPLNTPHEHLSLLLAQQICHCRAHDPFWGVIRRLCVALHWFNPLVWVASWLSWRDSEMACDDSVTAKLHDMDRLAYANVIVSAGERGAAAVSAEALGASFTDKHIRQRVTSVIRCVRGSRAGIAAGSLLAAVVLVASFATGESKPLPTVSTIPAVSWAASTVPINDDMDAIHCAKHFLESEFIGEETAPLSFTSYLKGAQWLVEARSAQDAPPILLRFSQDGSLLEYDGTAALDNVAARASTSYTHRVFTDSVEEYLTAFMNALLPGRLWNGGVVQADVRAGDYRLLYGTLYDARGVTVCELTLQVEPTVKVLYCVTYFNEVSNG